MEDLEGVRERVRELVDEYSSGVPTRFAALLGMKWPTFRNYYEGLRVPAKKELKRFLEVTGVTSDWLLSGTGPKRSPVDQEDDSAFADIPLMRAVASAGGGLVPEEGSSKAYKFRLDWLSKVGARGSLYLVKVSGRSMEPTLVKGDTIMVDRTKTKPGKGIFVVKTRLDGVRVKRVERIVLGEKEVIRLTSDNEIENGPEYLDPSTVGFEVLGKVVWLGREME